MADPEAAVVVARLLNVPVEEVSAPQVGEEPLPVPRVGACAVPGLRRNQYGDTKEEGDGEALDALPCVLSVRALAKGEEGRRPGEEEQQRHVPGVDEAEHVVEGVPRFRPLDVEGRSLIEHPARVERKEEQDRQHTEPVDVMQPTRAHATSSVQAGRGGTLGPNATPHPESGPGTFVEGDELVG